MKKKIYIFRNAIKLFFWGLKNPKIMQVSNFELMSNLLNLIFKAAQENKPYMSQISYVTPDENKYPIISIWVGVGIGASPTKRIKELIEENELLKIQILNTLNKT